MQVKQLLDYKNAVNFINDYSSKLINYYPNYDHYGSYKSLKNYITQPKLLFSKSKYNIKSYLKSLEFSRNFFG